METVKTNAKIFVVDGAQVLFYKDFEEANEGTVYHIQAVTWHRGSICKMGYGYTSKKKRNGVFADLTEAFAEQHLNGVSNAFTTT